MSYRIYDGTYYSGVVDSNEEALALAEGLRAEGKTKLIPV